MGINNKGAVDFNDPTYRDFIFNIRLHNNKALNRVLWFCLLAGPLLALGKKLGPFSNVSYDTCIWVSALMAGFALTHLLMVKFDPASILTSFWPLFALNLLIVYMECANIKVGLIHCLVPVLSLLFCDISFFMTACVVNYIAIIYATWRIAEYNAALRVDGVTKMEWFVTTAGGFTLEAIIMCAAGFVICYTIISYIKSLYENRQQISSHLKVISSMAEIYDAILLIDYEHKKISHMNSDGKTCEAIEFFDIGNGYISGWNRNILEDIKSEYREAFEEFVNIDTVKERLGHKKSIFQEFQSATAGWFRAQYIRVESVDADCLTVIYTIENIEDEKRREEQLIKMSTTDELTRLYNRRSYDEDISIYDKENMPDDLVFVMADVNGLKQTNDTLGHEAGDELICGVSSVLLAIFGKYGKVYRTGGDEFAAIIRYDGDLAELRNKLKKKSDEWSGKIVKNMYLSVGFAKHTDNPNGKVPELEKLADVMMYKEKDAYYREKGTDRRGQQAAFNAIGNLYTRVLRINLSDNTYSVLKSPDPENPNIARPATFTEWIYDFAEQGMVYMYDKETFYVKTDINSLSNYFASGKDYFSINYRRKFGAAYKYAKLEIIAAADYTVENQYVYMYVKEYGDLA